MKNFLFWLMVVYQTVFVVVAITNPDMFILAFDAALEAMKPETCKIV